MASSELTLPRNGEAGNHDESMVWDLFRRNFETWPGSASDVRDLDVRRRTLFLVCVFDGEVENGGLLQWFTNPTGELVAETCEAFAHIGRNDLVALIGAALALFPDGLPYIDTSGCWGESPPTEQQQSALNALGGRYEALRPNVFKSLLESWAGGDETRGVGVNL
jgi:hypothetical protein